MNFYEINAFADWMATSYCSRSLLPGEIIMNNVVLLSDERHLIITRNGEEIQSGSQYIPGETLQVMLSDTHNQYLFETDFGRFLDGGCEGKRIANHKTTADIIMPTDGIKEINIKAGWAMGHSVVRTSSPFILLLNSIEQKEIQKLDLPIEETFVKHVFPDEIHRHHHTSDRAKLFSHHHIGNLSQSMEAITHVHHELNDSELIGYPAPLLSKDHIKSS
jgi:hypothetical protein